MLILAAKLVKLACCHHLVCLSLQRKRLPWRANKTGLITRLPGLVVFGATQVPQPVRLREVGQGPKHNVLSFFLVLRFSMDSFVRCPWLPDGFIERVVFRDVCSPRSAWALLLCNFGLRARFVHYRCPHPNLVPRSHFVGLQGHCVIELYVGAYPETCRFPVTQRFIAPSRSRLVVWAAPFWADLPSGHIAAPGCVLGLHSCHHTARQVGTSRPVPRWRLQVLGAGIAFCFFLCCLFWVFCVCVRDPVPRCHVYCWVSCSRNSLFFCTVVLAGALPAQPRTS